MSQQQAGNLQGMAQNPGGFVMKKITPLIEALPKVLPLVAIASAMMSIPQTVQLIANKLTEPGGPFDIRYRRIVQEEVMAGLSREEQDETRTARRLVAFSGQDGYAKLKTEWGYSNYYAASESRLNRATLSDKAAGLRF